MTIKVRRNMPKVIEPCSGKLFESECEQPKKRNDFVNICLLLFLYILQGIPLGLVSSLALILHSGMKHADYNIQAYLSATTWPFSLKLAWAPLVDAIYSSRIGRRKSWLIPIQYAIGIDLIVLAAHVDEWLGRAAGNSWGALEVVHPVEVTKLVIAFFGLLFLAATQDIVVDGWAITMLSKNNLGWASTCNSVGQYIGICVSSLLFLSLESPEICNTYLRSTPVEGQGLITFSGFLYFWGISFIVTTTIIAVLKHETDATVTKPVDACLSKLSVKLAASTAVSRLSVTSQAIRLRRQNKQLARHTDTAESATMATETDRLDLEEPNISFAALPGAVDRDESIPLFSDHAGAGNRHEDNGDVVAGEAISLYSAACCSGSVIEVKPEDDDIGHRKRSRSDSTRSSNDDLSLFDTYRVMFGLLQLKPVLQYIALLCVVKIFFAASDALVTLKLIEQGLTKEKHTFLGFIMTPLTAALPLLIIRWTNGPRPLAFLTLAIIPRLICMCLYIPFIYYQPYFRITTVVNGTAGNMSSGHPPMLDLVQQSHNFTWSFYVILLVQNSLYGIFTVSMFVSQMAYHARISDPSVGGTYMTLLNTASNLAGAIPHSIALFFMPTLSWHSCDNPNVLAAGLTHWQTMFNQSGGTANRPLREEFLKLGKVWLTDEATCTSPAGIKACELVGGTCSTIVDGYYVEVIASVIFAFLAFPMIVLPLSRKLDALPSSALAFRLPPSSAECPPRWRFTWWPFSKSRRQSRVRKSSNAVH